MRVNFIKDIDSSKVVRQKLQIQQVHGHSKQGINIIFIDKVAPKSKSVLKAMYIPPFALKNFVVSFCPNCLPNNHWYSIPNLACQKSILECLHSWKKVGLNIKHWILFLTCLQIVI